MMCKWHRFCYSSCNNRYMAYFTVQGSTWPIPIKGQYCGDVPIIGSAISNGLYWLVFSCWLSDQLVYEISSRSDIIGGQ